MMNYRKYQRQYYLPPEKCVDWVEKDYVDHAPIWPKRLLNQAVGKSLRTHNLKSKKGA